MNGIFHTRKPKGPRRQAMLAAVAEAHPERFPTPEAVASWMDLVFVPSSKRWSYVRNGKAGTSSTLRFLFELEFGVPLSVELVLPSDINPDVAPHQLASADVFRQLSGFVDGLPGIEQALRLATVRHPVDRAISAFLYLCRTQDEAHPWFSRERLRMNAAVGLNWRDEARTENGFVKFLEYIEITLAEYGPGHVNAHWRPQVETVLPTIYRPSLVGKVESLGVFLRDIAERLDRPLPADWTEPRANVSDDRAIREGFATPAALRLIETIFSKDFEAFGYAPDGADI